MLQSPAPSSRVPLMNDRQALLLAYGIVEYQTVLDHLEALRTVGVSVPFITLGRIETEQRRLMRRWLWDHGDPRFSPDRVPEILSEVRDWLSQHVEEMDLLLQRERTDEQAEG